MAAQPLATRSYQVSNVSVGTISVKVCATHVRKVIHLDNEVVASRSVQKAECEENFSTYFTVMFFGSFS